MHRRAAWPVCPNIRGLLQPSAVQALRDRADGSDAVPWQTYTDGAAELCRGQSVCGKPESFLSEAPWKATELALRWRERFVQQLAPKVAQLHADHRAARPKRPGCPKASIVTGYLIGDDSTCHKMRGKKMEGARPNSVGCPRSGRITVGGVGQQRAVNKVVQRRIGGVTRLLVIFSRPSSRSKGWPITLCPG